ncbi:phosphoribosylamine--glycine ligase [Deinococcus radiophilus]|uniref:Phosphoribosylamine--glycine ligase n=1 Tax=Deinococcus radiophilus TaxID=32062 RepID=A0A431VWA7_9DEIO|nr:phosphoribosylamine--glycine ligase [Deinococcus radiophilus]RTR27514.1 phosphoribosylamine--glycine ligase [Deinococcus radiophilus]UFA50383.1 phosphoribosylamine--glycine ligase [Deinococcus radiophilus]
MKVLVIGNGAREHAIAEACARQGHTVLCTPGNPGIAEVAEVLQSPQDNAALVALAQERGAELVIVGPETYLAQGLADELRAAGIPTFGPNRETAQIETDKAWSKAFMDRHGVPTAAHQAFETLDGALSYLDAQQLPVVVKDAGLRAGKGVTIAHTRTAAEQALTEIFGQPGAAVVIEEFMTGQEVSILAITDGERFALTPPSQDHKTIGDGDTGPMTGGMGVICPFPVSETDLDTIRREIVERTLAGLREEGCEFCGVLYAGLMLTPDGPKVVEFNARFGDPEAEAVLPLLVSDLAAHALAAAQGRLNPEDVKWRDAASAVVILAAPGYPGTPQKGIPLTLPQTGTGEYLFHAGTAEGETGKLVSSGGRVLAVTATAGTLPDALTRAYALSGQVGFAGAQRRGDIGLRIGLRPGPEPA